jgi:hypothetical protein
VADDIDNEVDGSGLSHPWTRRALTAALIPLLGWDAASVFQLAMAVGNGWYIAWIPALSTSGLMLAATQIAQRATDPDVRRHATWLAWTALVMGVFIAGVQHVLPAHLEHVPWYWRALVGSLPVAAGGWLYHIYATGTARAKAVAEAARAAQRVEAAAQREAEIARTHAAEAAERDRITAERQRAEEIAHAKTLADLAAKAANAEAAAAAEVARKLAAQRQLDDLVTSYAKPRAVASRARATNPGATTLKAKAIAELVRRHRAGDDIRQTVGADLDRAIGASVGYSKKLPLKDVIDHVLEIEQEGAA